MENLIKQMSARGKLSSAGQRKTEDSSSIRNQGIPPKKTQSFKGGKRIQHWFQKQFAGQMTSWDNDSDYEMEQVAAVAAAAYVINLNAESRIEDQTKTSVDLESSSRKEDKIFPIRKPGILSKQYSGSRRGSESSESKVIATDVPDVRRAPSFKKPVTFADHIGSSSNTKPRGPQNPDLLTIQPEIEAAKPDLQPIKPRTAAPRPEQPPPTIPLVSEIEAKPPSAARPVTEAQKEADAWEKAEMAKIKEKYVKLNSKILAWEEKQKKKARNKLDKAEQSEVEKKKAGALTKFRKEMEYIKEVADGARAQAQARQRNDEFKVKEKANKIRETGKVPSTCFCC